jgi:hypothetical protein
VDFGALRLYYEVSEVNPKKVVAAQRGYYNMKNTVRAFVVVLALSGAVAGMITNHTAKAQQVATLGHQVISSAMPAPACSPQTCNIRGGN